MCEESDNTFSRDLELESCNITLSFIQKNLGEVNCVVWDAAIVLSKYLDICTIKNKGWLKNKKVLELGSGLGCVGITAACLGAHVIMTDLEKTLSMLKENVEINRKYWESLKGYCEIQKLDWGNKIDLDYKPEIVLLTDCVYYKESIMPLINTLEIFIKRENGFAILCQELRDTPNQITIWQEFLKELKKKFKVHYIPISEQHPVFSSNDILLMRISS